MPQKEPLPQNGGTTPPAPEIAQSGRLLMHVLRLHRKARVGFFENLLLPCAAPAAPADPKAVRQKGEGGLTRRKKRRAAGASCRAAFFRTSVRRRMRETQSVRQRTDSAVGSPVQRRDAVSSRRHAKKARAVRRRGKTRSNRRRTKDMRFARPFVCAQTGFPFPPSLPGREIAPDAPVFPRPRPRFSADRPAARTRVPQTAERSAGRICAKWTLTFPCEACRISVQAE